MNNSFPPLNIISSVCLILGFIGFGYLAYQNPELRVNEGGLLGTISFSLILAGGIGLGVSMFTEWSSKIGWRQTLWIGFLLTAANLLFVLLRRWLF